MATVLPVLPSGGSSSSRPPPPTPPQPEREGLLPPTPEERRMGLVGAGPPQAEEKGVENTPPPRPNTTPPPSAVPGGGKQQRSPRPKLGAKAKSAVTQLESETKSLLGRISAKGLKTARRAAHCTPTLEELRGVGFEEFVRTEVLGVSVGFLRGVTGVPCAGNGTQSKEGMRSSAGTPNGTSATTGRNANTPQGEGPPKKGESPRTDGGNRPQAGGKGAPPPPPPAPTRQSSRIRERRKCEPRTPDGKEREGGGQQRKKRSTPGGSATTPGSPSPAPAPTRSSSRIRERRKHGILSGELAESPMGLGPSGRGGPDGGSVTSLPRSLYLGGCGCGGGGEKRKTKNKKPPPRPRLFPDPQKLLDGVCKISLPEGWWDRRGIGGDTTGRGPAWAAGTRLGDFVVTLPIKQCAGGIGGTYDFTMLETLPVTVAEFRARADEYRKKQVGSEVGDDTEDETMDNLARKFWRRLGPTMEPPYYGADLEGTLFDGDEASGWNIDRLESCLSLLRADAANGDSDEHIRLPGVTSAYLYFGMWASTFAAHREDMNLLSINYLHAGAPKYWYAIGPDDSARFESLAVSHFPGAARDCPDFLRHKRYLLSPAQLTKAGIKYTTCVQRPGDAIITFPGSYHFGFNTGFNVAESTNFAVPEWVPLGDAASVCLCHPHSVRIDMRRFKQLLRKYEEDVDGMKMEGLDVGEVTYSEWAKYEARRIKQQHAAVDVGEDDVGNSGSSEGAEQKKKQQKKGTVVEVMRLKKNSVDSNPPKKKARKVSKEVEDWRLALRARPSVFLVTGTPVLCFVKAEGDESGGVDNSSAGDDLERCFSGSVVDAAEGHVRVHFTGSTKKEDVWFSADSPKIFLDGGPESAPGATEGMGAKGKGKR